MKPGEEEGTARPGAAPAEDPQSYSAWFRARRAAAILRSRLFDAEVAKNGLASRERIDHLERASRRGKDARKFLATEFWEKDLEPFLAAESALKPYNPVAAGLFSFPQLVADYVFGSGQARANARLVERLHAWDREGVAADKELDEYDRRQREADRAKAAAEAARR